MAIAVGERFVRRQAAARTGVSNTTVADFGYDTPVLSEGGYGAWASDQTSVDTAAPYLIIHGTGEADFNTSNRAVGSNSIKINGTSQAKGVTSHRYIRNSGGALEGVSFGAAIFNLSASDTIGCQVDGNTYGDALGSFDVAANAGGGLQIIRLPDGDFLDISRTTSQALALSNINGTRPWSDSSGTWTKISWPTETTDDGAWHDHAGSPGDITVAAGAKRIVAVTGRFESSDASRQTGMIRLVVDGTPVQGATGYHRNTASQGCHATLLYLVHNTGVSAITVHVEGTQEHEGTDGGTLNFTGSLQMLALPSSAEWIHVDNGATDSMTTAWAGTTTWYTAPMSSTVRADGGSDLSLDAANDAVQNDSGGSLGVLAIGWLDTDRDSGTSGTRKVPTTRFDNGGSSVDYGWGGSFNRGQQGGDDTFRSAHITAATLDMAAAADLTMVSRDQASGSNADLGVYASGGRHKLGMQVLVLDSLDTGGGGTTAPATVGPATATGGDATVAVEAPATTGAATATGVDATVESGNEGPTPVHETTATIDGGEGTTIVVSRPTGTAEDDLLIALLYSEASTGISALPTDWVFAVEDLDVTNHFLSVAYKWATASEPTSYTFEHNNENDWRQGYIARISGARGSGNPFDFVDSEPSTNDTSGVTPAVSGTTLGANRLLYWGGSNWASGNWTEPTGFETAVQHAPAGDDVLGFAVDEQATQGATGNVTGTCSQSEFRAGVLLAIKPALTSGGDTTASATVGPATASGADATTAVATNATTGPATATGADAAVATATTAPATQGAATAVGVDATTAISSSATTGTATAAGVDATVAVSTRPGSGPAVAVGVDATVSTETSTTATATLGPATATGTDASAAVTVPATTGPATASGLDATTAGSPQGTAGAVTATGHPATVGIVTTATVGPATAVGVDATVSSSAETTAPATTGPATASGAGAAVDVAASATVGPAIAAGVDATVSTSTETTATATVGPATAIGVDAAIVVATTAEVGSATAAGADATAVTVPIVTAPATTGPATATGADPSAAITATAGTGPATATGSTAAPGPGIPATSGAATAAGVDAGVEVATTAGTGSATATGIDPSGVVVTIAGTGPAAAVGFDAGVDTSLPGLAIATVGPATATGGDAVTVLVGATDPGLTFAGLVAAMRTERRRGSTAPLCPISAHRMERVGGQWRCPFDGHTM